MRQEKFVEDPTVPVDMMHLYSITMLAAKDSEEEAKKDKGQVAQVRAGVVARQVLARQLVVEEYQAQFKADKAVMQMNEAEIKSVATAMGQDISGLAKLAYERAKHPGKLQGEFRRLRK